jgi:hypothetical protein
MLIGCIFNTVMTKKEKFDAIMERVKGHGDGFTPFHLSLMMITSYVNKLHSFGVITPAHKIYSTGKDLIAICEEFDWKPTNTEIIEYVTEYVDDANRNAFIYLLTRFRDDPDRITEYIKKAKLK